MLMGAWARTETHRESAKRLAANIMMDICWIGNETIDGRESHPLIFKFRAAKSTDPLTGPELGRRSCNQKGYVVGQKLLPSRRGLKAA